MQIMSSDEAKPRSMVSLLDQTYSFDSLPYHDVLPTKEEKQAASKLIDEELKRFPKVKNYLADFPLDSERLMTPALKSLLKMAEKNTALEAIDESRFGVPDIEQLDTRDPNETNKALELFEVQLMYMDFRKLHLQLAQKYASGALRQSSSTLKYAADEIGRKSTKLKSDTFETHRERKKEHAVLGKKIREYEEQFMNTTQTVNDLRKAIAELQKKSEEHQKDIENIENQSAN